MHRTVLITVDGRTVLDRTPPSAWVAWHTIGMARRPSLTGGGEWSNNGRQGICRARAVRTLSLCSIGAEEEIQGGLLSGRLGC